MPVLKRLFTPVSLLFQMAPSFMLGEALGVTAE
jgi:hypothetical protein